MLHYITYYIILYHTILLFMLSYLILYDIILYYITLSWAAGLLAAPRLRRARDQQLESSAPKHMYIYN